MMHPKKYSSPPVMTASSYLDHFWPAEKRRSPPETVLVIMQPGLADFGRNLIKGRRYANVPAGVWLPTWWHKRKGLGVLGNIGIGGAAIVSHAELLAAWGVKKIILLGIAGRISDSVSLGDIVVPSMALRNDGVSDHYLPAADWSYPNKQLSQLLVDHLSFANTATHHLPVWTTCAPYRETRAEVTDYAARGAVAVEMEAASLFGAAQFLGVETGAAFVISDSLVEEAHKIDTNFSISSYSLRSACRVLVEQFSWF